MCLILFAWRQNAEYPLVLMANRDEFYKRPTAQASVWDEHSAIIAGKDLKGNGSWLGVTRQGRWAALTNYRAPSEMKPNAPTRGHLVSDYLKCEVSPQDYLHQILPSASAFNGFNLLVGNLHELWYFSNKGNKVKEVKGGIHGLSNHLLNTPWPKVERGKKKMAATLAQPGGLHYSTLIAHMHDTQRAPDSDLPQTGVGLSAERMLSPMFIESEGYGTCCSSVLLFNKEQQVTFVEKSYPNSVRQELTDDLRVFEWDI